MAGVRNIRAQRNIAQKETLELIVLNSEQLNTEESQLLTKLCHLSAVRQAVEKPNGAVSFIVETTEYAVPLEQFIDKDAERQKLQADLEYQQKFLQGVRAKLSNQKFVEHAKPEVVALERKKEQDALTRIATIEESLKQL